MKCPKCNSDMKIAFCSKTADLSYATPENFESFAFLDKDLSEAGMKKYLPGKGEWYPSYLCESCKVYVIEYGTTMDRKEVEKLIGQIKNP